MWGIGRWRLGGGGRRVVGREIGAVTGGKRSRGPILGGIMSCMEHTCTKCGWMEFNNNPRSPSICPKCGDSMFHQWDEQMDYEREESDECIEEEK